MCTCVYGLNCTPRWAKNGGWLNERFNVQHLVRNFKDPGTRIRLSEAGNRRSYSTEEILRYTGGKYIDSDSTD